MTEYAPSSIVGTWDGRWRSPSEVRTWYLALSPAGKAAADRAIERLASQGHLLRMPHSRALGDGLFELRFFCENVNRRITYVIDPDRMVVTLTTFRKQRSNERTEILRARQAQAAHKATRQADRRKDGAS